MLPIVADETRADWEKFVSQNTDWVTEALEYQTKNDIGQIEGETSTATPFVFPVINAFSFSDGSLVVDEGVRTRFD